MKKFRPIDSDDKMTRPRLGPIGLAAGLYIIPYQQSPLISRDRAGRRWLHVTAVRPSTGSAKMLVNGPVKF